MSVDTDQPVEDMTPTCGVCCVNDKTCIDESTVGSCRQDMTGFNPIPCAAEEVCMNGACVVPPVCVAGEKRCYDSVTLLTCRQTGDGFITSPCAENTSCIDGNCLSGLPAGQLCSTDDECASQVCRCGTGSDDVCPSSIQTGYCAAPGCTADSCGRDGVCFASDILPLSEAADFDHCLSKCAFDSCPTGMECISLPTRTNDGIVWENACYYSSLKAIGSECGSDTECVTGTCLRDYFDTGYCTRRCDEDSSCPADAACVLLRPNEFYCSLKCGTGSVGGTAICPLEAGGERFDVTCQNLPTPENSIVRTCAAR